MWIIFSGLLLFAVIKDWIAVDKRDSKTLYYAKPAVMVLLILASLYYAWPLNNPVKFFIVGLFFSLLGDIFLMLPKSKFVLGLLAFLFAHFAFISALGLFPITSQVLIPTIITILFLIPPTVLAIKQFSQGLRISGKNKLIFPVAIYSITLATFVLAGLSHFFNQTSPIFVAYLFSTGVLLFLISDLMLAFDRFVAEIPKGQLKIHITYHLAQILLTLGFLIKYS